MQLLTWERERERDEGGLCANTQRYEEEEEEGVGGGERKKQLC